MNNWKQRAFSPYALIGMVAIIALGFGFIGCDNKSEVEVIDYPKDQSQIITLTFETESPTATVKGHLTNTQWIGVPVKIKNAINGVYTAGNGPTKGRFKNVFVEGVTIIVEKTPSGYTKWKTSADGKTMWLAFGKLDDDLQGSVDDAVGKMIIPIEGNG